MPDAPATLIRNAHVLTMDDRDTEYPRADILVRGTTIAAVETALPVAAGEAGLRVIDGAGLLAMPGLINGHVHSPGNFMKGALDAMPLGIRLGVPRPCVLPALGSRPGTTPRMPACPIRRVHQ